MSFATVLGSKSIVIVQCYVAAVYKQSTSERERNYITTITVFRSKALSFGLR